MSHVNRYTLDMVNFQTGEDSCFGDLSYLEMIKPLLSFFKSQVYMILPDEEVHLDIIVRRL